MSEFRIQDVLKTMPLMPDQFENMTPEEQEEYLAPANVKAREAIQQSVVFGHDHKTVKGEPVEQGIGARGRESGNHFASILRYEGKEAFDAAVAELHKRDPKRHAALKLPVPKKAAG